MAYLNVSRFVASITTNANPVYFLLMQSYHLSRGFSLVSISNNHRTGTYFSKSFHNVVNPCQKDDKFEINILGTKDFSERFF